jgi:hypothetical protein
VTAGFENLMFINQAYATTIWEISRKKILSKGSTSVSVGHEADSD